MCATREEATGKLFLRLDGDRSSHVVQRAASGMRAAMREGGGLAAAARAWAMEPDEMFRLEMFRTDTGYEDGLTKTVHYALTLRPAFEAFLCMIEEESDD